MITLTIPISHADVALLPDFTRVLCLYGPYKGFSCFLFPTSEVRQEAEQAKANLDGLFDKVEVVEANTVTQKGWPVGPNQHFQFIAKWAAGNVPHAFYFMELDCTPNRPDWLHVLDAEYQTCGKPYMGAIVPTLGRKLNPDGTPGAPAFKGEHMVGTGIYHAQYALKSPLLPFLNSKMPWQKSPVAAFDVRITEEIVPYAHRTSLIQHNLRTLNYRADDGIILCDDHPTNLKESGHAKPVRPDAAVLHGCKDGSFARFILDATKRLIGPVPQFKELPKPEQAPEPEVKPKINHPSFLAVQIRNLVNVPGKSWRVANLAEHFKLEEREIKEAIRQNAAILEITKPGGWVKLKRVAVEPAAV